MAQEQLCHKCGEFIPFGEAKCPRCAVATRKPAPPAAVVVALVAITAVLFVITHFVSQAYEKQEQALAVEWFQRGEKDSGAARVEPAIEDYRNALAYSHENSQYRLKLAEALESAGRERESAAYLRALWDERPGDGTINLQLARLAARSGDINGALRYFHGAIYGVWDDNPEQHRRDARVELIQFLLQRKRPRLALSELIQQSTDMPRDPAFVARVGNMFLQAGDAERALSAFRSALAMQKANAEALAGAARSAFALRQYREAEPLLREAVERNPQDAELASLRQQNQFVLNFSPYMPHLSVEERNRRVQHLFDVATQRLQTCAQQRLVDLTAIPPQNDLQSDALQAREVRTSLRPPGLAKNPDLQDVAMDLITKIENETLKVCGAPTGDDQAIMLILQQRERA